MNFQTARLFLIQNDNRLESRRGELQCDKMTIGVVFSPTYTRPVETSSCPHQSCANSPAWCVCVCGRVNPTQSVASVAKAKIAFIYCRPLFVSSNEKQQKLCLTKFGTSHASWGPSEPQEGTLIPCRPGCAVLSLKEESPPPSLSLFVLWLTLFISFPSISFMPTSRRGRKLVLAHEENPLIEL